ncbi:carboxypeptidase-like regulatory domain-containing protein [Myxococcus sp. K15C18031901]|uniref:MSCRAMM family protein n=1 Tax=Myxococcus dinghuensis TaxID=2906761 RepID=UPI0020A7CF47|nr:carboxypeptidase-like regulatory domain-containing protein [Myxococcus dinghuensis]MCP3099316.1 carboxypeptidase-like regulatory domain-containing protein [Myxococcus dinghuensis]
MATALHKQFLTVAALVAVALGVVGVWHLLPGAPPAGTAQSPRPVPEREALPPPPRGSGVLQGTVVAWDDTPVAGVEVSATLSQPGRTLSALPCGEEFPDLPLSAGDCEGTPVLGLIDLIEQGLGAAPVVARTTSRADGTFSLTGLPEGALAVWALDARGAGVLPRSVAVGATGLKLVLREAATVSGRVVDEGRHPLPGANVTLFLAEHSRFFEATTDARGRFSFGPLPAGRPHGLVAYQPGLLAAHVPLDVPEDLDEDLVLHAPHRVSGRVLDAGRPVADAEVVSVETGRSARTDGDGRFVLEDLLLGHTQLTATLGKRRGHAWTQLMEGKPEPEVVIVLGPVFTLRGTVTTLKGHPVPAATIEVAGTDNARTLTDARGHFVFESLTPGRYTVTVRAEDYADQRIDYAYDPSTPSPETQAPANDEPLQEAPTVDVVLHPSFRVGGVLVDPEGRPVSGAIVQLAGGDGPLGEAPLPPPRMDARKHPDDLARLHETRVTEVRTDDQGRFAFERARPDRLSLRVDSDRYIPLHTVVDAPATDLRLVLQEGARLQGSVVDAQGLPLDGVQLSLRAGPDSRVEVVTPTESDAQGRFTFGGLPPGHYVLQARLNQGARHEATLPLDVLDTRTLSPVVRLDTGLSISGTVVDASNNPVPHLELRATSTDGKLQYVEQDERIPSWATTDEQGRFTVKHLPPGACELSTRRAGHTLGRRGAGAADSTAEVRVPAGATDVTLELRYLGGVRGRLVGEDGHPISYFILNAEEHRDPDGSFQVDRRPSGPTTLSLSAPGRTPIEREVEVAPGQLVDLGDILVKPERKLRGRVTHALTGAPLPSVEVALFRTDPGGLPRRLDGSSRTAPDGTFELDGVETTALFLEVTGSDLPRHRQAIGAGDTWVDVRMQPGAKLLGTVRDAEGRPRASVLVMFTEPPAPREPFEREVQYIWGDAQGFVKEGIVPGTYWVVPQPDLDEGGRDLWFKPQTVVATHGSVHVLDFQVQRGSARLTLLAPEGRSSADDSEAVSIEYSLLVEGDLRLSGTDARLRALRRRPPMADAEGHHPADLVLSELPAGRYTYFLVGNRGWGMRNLAVHREVVDVKPGDDITRRIVPQWVPLQAEDDGIRRHPCRAPCTRDDDGWSPESHEPE